MIKKRLIVIAFALFGTCFITGCDFLDAAKNGVSGDEAINIETESEKTDKSSDDENLLDDKDVADKIDEINAYIDEFYYFETDKEAKEEALYDGIMEGLGDPYSVYYTADEYADLLEDNSGEYVGIGAVVTQDVDMLVSVVRPIPGSPAEEAGLLAGDIFVEIDGVEIIDQELSLVVDMIRGQEGTKAQITIFRQSINEYIDFEIERRVVENVSVYTDSLDNNIGYIQVQQFYENTPSEFTAAFEKFEAEGVDGVIIDLRDNPGGLLSAVVDMCDYIMDEGVIVTTKDKYDNVISEHVATSDHYLDIPMVVLINGNSASASEIFAGAMQDTGMAKIVGTNSYGKGIVQSIIPLEDGTAIKLTIAKYFTPLGRDIHEIGIAPDYEISLEDGRLNAVNIEYDEDVQLHKAEEVILEMINK